LRGAAMLTYEEIRALGKMGDIDALFKALDESDLETQKDVIAVLGKLDNPTIKDKIFPLLHHADPGIQNAVKASLAELKDERIINWLIEDLEESDDGRRKKAFVGLAGFELNELNERLAKKTLLGGPDLLTIVREFNFLNHGKTSVSIVSEYLDVYLISTNYTYMSDYEIYKNTLTAIEFGDPKTIVPIDTKHLTLGKEFQIIPGVGLELLSMASGVCGKGSSFFSDRPRIERVRINKTACPITAYYKYSYEYMTNDYSGAPRPEYKEYSVQYV
jgi:hypothetical protein